MHVVMVTAQQPKVLHAVMELLNGTARLVRGKASWQVPVMAAIGAYMGSIPAGTGEASWTA